MNDSATTAATGSANEALRRVTGSPLAFDNNGGARWTEQCFHVTICNTAFNLLMRVEETAAFWRLHASITHTVERPEGQPTTTPRPLANNERPIILIIIVIIIVIIVIIIKQWFIIRVHPMLTITFITFATQETHIEITKFGTSHNIQICNEILTHLNIFG